MAKSGKINKSMSARSKGMIALVLLLAVTVFVSYLSVAGIHYGEDGVMQLLPWVPVSSENWPESLQLSRNLGGGVSFLLKADGELTEDAMENACASVEKRMQALGETDYSIAVEGDALRVQLPVMDDELLHEWISYVSVPGKFELRSLSGEATVFSPAYAKSSLGVNSTNTGYQLTMEFSKEDTATLKEVAALHGNYYYAFCDGERLSGSASVAQGKVILNVYQDANVATNVAFWCENPLPAAFTHSHDGDGQIAATGASVIPAALIVSAVLLAAGLIYLIANGKFTGISAIITVWCAVMLEFFLYATLVLEPISVLNLMLLVVGLVLALYAAAVRTKEISALIAEGNTPKSANKVGMRAAARNVWLAHGVLLAIGLILMIFPFSRIAGYTLGCAVAGSALVMPVMRAFQACFIAISNKSANFGKVR